jgi:nitroimidazol reductase NimA-like FMN-containing flavoprotein (pyridoxamine 5'-phosphate oxidase superfamily)
MGLSERECLDLLASRSVGRVVFADENGPLAVPVNYVMDGEAVLFRTAAHNTLGRHLRDAVAAFEIDDVDDYNETGWSVLVRGRTTYAESDELPTAEDALPYAWPEGTRALVVRLSPQSISGRRLLPG